VPIESQSNSAESSDLQRILQVEVPVIVKLAERKLPLGEVMRLGPGFLLEFPKRADQPLELMVNNQAIAVGHAVKVGDNIGLKITRVGDARELIASLASPRR
jgi:flagellar motor switch protein FliN